MTDRYVWYASYGSNLLRARFDCYLKGTKLDGQRYGCAGARDTGAPHATCSIDVPHRLFFARNSERWGGGGIAFLDPSPQAGCRARLRMYKITLEQFNDVLAQENRLPVPPPPDLSVTPERLDELSQTAGMGLSESPYGYLKYLGVRDGCPVLTFTCSPQAARLAAEGARPWHFNVPSEAYAGVIKRGLAESGMDADEAQSYILCAMARPWHTPDAPRQRQGRLVPPAAVH